HFATTPPEPISASSGCAKTTIALSGTSVTISSLRSLRSDGMRTILPEAGRGSVDIWPVLPDSPARMAGGPFSSFGSAEPGGSVAKLCPGQRGFTLAEVLVATAFIAVAFGAVGLGFMQGTSSVEIGRQQTTAVYLAEQRLEQVKAWSLSSDPNRGFSTLATGAACCQNDAYNTVPSYGNYRRTVTVTALGANNKVLQVSVFYFAVNSTGGNAGRERRVDVSTVVTSR